jgi:hypothetical protein
LLIALAVLTAVFMAMHPTSGTHDADEFVARTARGIPGNAAVHGILIVLMLLMAPCFLALRDVLGPHRLVVRVGLVAFIVGSAGGVVAGLINGFIVPGVASRRSDTEHSARDAIVPVFELAREANATCARVCVLGLCMSAVLWSAALLSAPGHRRWVGAAGAVCGVLPIVLLATGHLPTNVAGFGVFVVAHAVWSLLSGIVLVRARSDA